MDREYIILNEIYKDEHITQRELSEKADLSLGSVNLLLKKMVKDGLIKIKQIPANRIAYMLTPKGMSEKLTKTYRYIQYHYNYIHEMKNRIKDYLLEVAKGKSPVQVILSDDELGQLIKAAVAELSDIPVVTDLVRMDMQYPIIVAASSQYPELLQKGYQLESLLEKL